MTDYELAKILFRYDPETGKVFRVAKLSWKRNIIRRALKEITCVNHYGYLQVNFQGRPYHLHRIIFLLQEGKYPENDVDHLDGDRTNNKWSNLRKVTRSENLKNVGIKRNNTTGFHGVSFRKDDGKFTTYIDVNGIRYRGGVFDNLEDAVNKRKQMEKHFQFHKNHGKRLGWSEN